MLSKLSIIWHLILVTKNLFNISNEFFVSYDHIRYKILTHLNALFISISIHFCNGEHSDFNSESSKSKSFLTTVPMIRVPSLMVIHCRSKSLAMLILKWWLISTEILRKVAHFIWSFCNI